ncbi:carbon storage regulator CsrA [Cohnella fermenti]|uniref:Translational regulator CsrA n=1 Tax=Cohnella fermenti TaxID=2565925 RepID=A0A4S4BZQ7_9BACL|nr:carbon storage regulator CsrA [Cohnella fermenti]THF80806.1 carbon storage regulator CsrA [Cohnella fermenti]
MLVLKRKVGETIMIGDGIEVQVLSVEGETVKLGFNAPSSVQILRKELFEMIRQENIHAGKPETVGQTLVNLLREVKIKSDKE